MVYNYNCTVSHWSKFHEVRLHGAHKVQNNYFLEQLPHGFTEFFLDRI